MKLVEPTPIPPTDTTRQFREFTEEARNWHPDDQVEAFTVAVLWTDGTVSTCINYGKAPASDLQMTGLMEYLKAELLSERRRGGRHDIPTGDTEE